MLRFLLRRSATVLLTALCLTFVVFYLTNLPPNLEKVAKSEVGTRISDAEVTSWLEKNGYAQPVLKRYGEWLGVAPGWTLQSGTTTTGRCIARGQDPSLAPRFCGVLQGEWGFSNVFREPVSQIVSKRLGLTGWLMLCVMLVMVPASLLIGILAGMREGSRLDRGLSTFSISTTATPEYVSGVLFITIFASSVTGLKWFKGTATSAMDQITFDNFTLPVLT
ncbi:MAG TPA: ABC transporter permease, partial [Paracoccaceae bacterium]